MGLHRRKMKRPMEKVDKKKRGKRYLQMPMWVTAVLILFIVGASFFASERINRMEEEKSFDDLAKEAEGLAASIEFHMEGDRELLELLADLIATYDELDSPKMWETLDSYSALGMMSRVELLLPDDSVITQGGERIDAAGRLSFEKEAAQGAHITKKEEDLTEEGKPILRHYVPVVRKGETVAMLYGIIDLETLPEDFLTEAYGGQAAVYIIEGETGDFLLDTWHGGTGNIWELGERPMAPGYDHEQLKQGLIDGKIGYVVFVSRTIGSYLYFYYCPMQINDWRLAMSVPEAVVFSRASAIQNVLNIFLAFEVISCILYFLWMLRYIFRQMKEKQRQLDTVNEIYEVEKLLFNAHERQENIEAALERIGLLASAEGVSFWMAGDSENEDSFVWGKWEDESVHRKFSEKGENIRRLLEYFEEGHEEFAAYDAQEFHAVWQEEKPERIKNLLAVPVEGRERSICGILFVYNMARKRAVLPLLKSVAFSFSLFCYNMRSYYSMKEHGETDLLTGLYNRNRYELDLPDIAGMYQTSLACIYMDVNGLHELNNSQGHEAGDEMLKAVAEEIRIRFGSDHTYRIGGDEFLIFAIDMEEETIRRLIDETERQLERRGFYISTGFSREEQVSSLQALIKMAEKKMYAAKKAYYDRAQNDRRRRERMPSQE